MIPPKWRLREPEDKDAIERLSQELSVDATVARLLAVRGISDFEAARQFFRPSPDMLHDPFLMRGMDAAVERLERALGDGDRILVYGDYDVDGTTAVALVYGFLREVGAQCDYYIPDRYAEGYGLSTQGIDYAAQQGFSLIIALDCGIRAVDKAAHARSLGISLIICDHHLPGDTLPDADAVLDPKQPGCDYPYKELCGCGVGFKLMQGLCIRGGMDMAPLMARLDLVAVAIAADIVPITGENRVLAKFGMERINTAPCTGIRVLLENASVKRELSITDAVFIIGPRINAAGRIASGRKAVGLLLADDKEEASVFAREIAAFNNTRRELDRDVTAEALGIIAQDGFYRSSRSTVVFSEGWHKGVVGIVASRLIDHHYKPTIVLTAADGIATGSARSVEGFDVHEAICKCSDLLEKFGGHAHAAGLSLKVQHVDEFRSRFEAVVADRITEDMLHPVLHLDAELRLADITPKLLRILKQFAPHGPGNLAPVFVSRGLRVTDTATVGGDGAHLRLKVSDPAPGSPAWQCIAFKMGSRFLELKDAPSIDLAYTIEENHFRGEVSLQLQVKDFRVVGNESLS